MSLLDFTVGTWDYFYLGDRVKHKNICKYFSIAADGSIGVDIPYVQYDSLAVKTHDSLVRLCVISDTHDRHHLLEQLPPCDILIHAGDIFMHSSLYSHSTARKRLKKFNKWLQRQPATHKLVIAGNHDQILMDLGKEQVAEELSSALYLCNSSVELFGLHIWGSPVSRGRSGNSAFQSPEFESETFDVLQRISSPVDILVTHGPCEDICRVVQPRKLHIFGHVHANHGARPRYAHRESNIHEAKTNTVNICAPITDHKYKPVQLPIVVDIHSSL